MWGGRDLFLSELAHRRFDELSSVQPESRTEGDLIDSRVLDRVESKLSELNKISEYVSAHIAHPGNQESRKSTTLAGFELEDARATLKCLKEIADLTSLWFANYGGADLTTYIGNQFEGLDKPMVNPEEIPMLLDNWYEIESEIASWKISVADL